MNNFILSPLDGSRRFYGSIRNIPKYFKLRLGKMPLDFTINSKDPSVRCTACGWKYNFQLVTKCPACDGNKAVELSFEDPISNPINWLIAMFLLAGFFRLLYFIGFEL